MGPIPPDNVEGMLSPASTLRAIPLQEVIQDLFELQSTVHGYLGPQTQQVLVHKIPQLAGSLAALSSAASTITTKVPPEIIDYIDDGRNPDIYTRDLVEAVQKWNRNAKGQTEAFSSFAAILADEISKSVPELKDDVTRILSGGSAADLKENGHGNA